MLQYDLDARKAGSLYEELVRRMRGDIVAGRIAAGEHLPSKRDLARALGVSVITVEHAYQQLIAEGYVHAVERRGYFANDIGSFAPAASLLGGARTLPERELEPEMPLPPCAYDFTGGVAPGSFPRQAWAKLTREVLDDAADDVLLRPAQAIGVAELRRAIAKHVARFRGMSVSPEQIIVGAGTQTFYSLLAQLMGRGSCFAVENPGYPRLAQAYRMSGVKAVLVDMDDEGISIEGLRDAGATVAHVMPSHHFPTGAVMPISRRYELLAWAAEQPGRYIIEDDYDCEFRHSGRPIPALQSIDADEKVIYLNTFTRSLAPSLRVGYMVLPVHLMRRFRNELGFYASSVSTLEQLVLARFMERGFFDTHVNRMRRRYRDTRDAALSALEGSGLIVHGKDAGLHFVLDCGKQLDEVALREALLAAGVRVHTLGEYRQGFAGFGEGDSAFEHNTCLVISYAALSADDAAEGIRVIRRVLEH